MSSRHGRTAARGERCQHVRDELVEVSPRAKRVGLADQYRQVRCSHRCSLSVHKGWQAVHEPNQLDMVDKHGCLLVLESQVDSDAIQLGSVIVAAMRAHEEADAARRIEPVRQRSIAHIALAAQRTTVKWALLEEVQLE